jgi:hypothetical protein
MKNSQTHSKFLLNFSINFSSRLFLYLHIMVGINAMHMIMNRAKVKSYYLSDRLGSIREMIEWGHSAEFLHIRSMGRNPQPDGYSSKHLRMHRQRVFRGWIVFLQGEGYESKLSGIISEHPISYQ